MPGPGTNQTRGLIGFWSVPAFGRGIPKGGRGGIRRAEGLVRAHETRPVRGSPVPALTDSGDEASHANNVRANPLLY